MGIAYVARRYGPRMLKLGEAVLEFTLAGRQPRLPVGILIVLVPSFAGCPSRGASEAPEGEQAAVTVPTVAVIGAPEPIEETKTSSTGRGPAMVRIPGGSFWMGSGDDTTNENPERWTTVESFELDVTEVTVAQYRECVAAGACEPPIPWEWSRYCNWKAKHRDDHAVNCLSWEGASAYCEWAGKRLPLEEEWEYAARGTDGSTYPWGEEPPRAQLCWHRKFRPIQEDQYAADDDETTKQEGTCAVGTHPADTSSFGAKDLGGNVSELTWTESCDLVSRTELGTCGHIARGGYWYAREAHDVRATVRREFASFFHAFGFRCAR